MKKRIAAALGFLALLILLPAVLREKPPVQQKNSEAADTLIILTPHAESIKHEFERGFQKYYFEKYNIKLPDDFIEHVLSNIPSQS